MLKTIVIIMAMLIAASATAGQVQYDIRVDGITCPFCVATSEQELKRIDGVQTVTADLEQGVIMVCADDSVEFSDSQLRQLFLNKGFTFREFTRSDDCNIAAQG